MSQNYHFGAGEFNKELWIAQKRVFERLKGVDVEFLTAGNWDWLIADETGTIVKTLQHNGGGWTSIDMPSLGLYKNYSVGFHNLSPSRLKIRGGDIRFG